MAGGSLGSLIVSLTLQAAQFQQGLQQAAKDLKVAEQAADKLADAVKAAGAAILAALSYEGMVRLAEYADSMGRLASAAGLTAEQFSELSYAASRSNVEAEAFQSSMAKLSSSIGAAVAGSKEQQAAFKALGVEFESSRGKAAPTEEVFMNLTEAYTRLDDGAKKNMISAALFGKAYQGILPVLNSGREGIQALRDEANAVGVVISSKLAADSSTFLNTIGAIKDAGKGAALVFYEELLPSLQVVAGKLAELSRTRDGLEKWAYGLKFAFVMVAQTVTGLSGAFVLLGKTIAGLSAIKSSIASFNPKEAYERAKILLVELEDQVNDTTKTIKDLWASLDGPPKQEGPEMDWGAPPPRIDDTITKTKEATSAIESYLDSLRKAALQAAIAAQASSKMSEAMRQHADVVAAQRTAEFEASTKGATEAQVRLAGVLAASTEMAKQYTSAVDAARAVTEANYTPLEKMVAEEDKLDVMLAKGTISLETHTRAVAKLRQEYAAADPELVRIGKDFEEVTGILSQTPSGRSEDISRRMGLLKEAYEQERFGLVGSEEAMKKYGEAVSVVMGTAANDVKDNMNFMQKYSESFAEGAQKSLEDFLFDPFSKGAKGMVDEFATALRRMVAQAASAELMKKLTESSYGQAAAAGGGGWLGLVGSLIGGLFGGSSGSSTPSYGAGGAGAPVSAFAGARANGGGIGAGQWALVGENGPELVTVGADSMVYNAQDTARMMGGRTQIFNITTPNADSFRSSERQIRRAAMSRYSRD